MDWHEPCEHVKSLAGRGEDGDVAVDQLMLATAVDTMPELEPWERAIVKKSGKRLVLQTPRRPR